MSTVAELAGLAGLQTQWTDYRGVSRTVEHETLQRLLEALGLPCASGREAADSVARLHSEAARAPALVTAWAGEPVSLPPAVRCARAQLRLENGESLALEVREGAGGGMLEAVSQPGYHRLQAGDVSLTLAVAPPRAYGVDDAGGGRRLWGLGAAMYALRRPGDGGIGDFTALAQLARAAAARGADALATSPVHALFAADPERFSPYSPSSRLFLNPLHADAASIAGDRVFIDLVQRAGLGGELERLEAAELLDWPAAARAKFKLLRAVHVRLHAQGTLVEELEAFRLRGGEALRDHACFEALQAQHYAQGAGPWSWRSWPADLRDPRGAGVAAAAAQLAPELGFHVFLQWIAERGLAGAQQAARAAGMAIGLVGDLAVGTDGNGSHAWSRQDDVLRGASVGAPPDLINPLGQDWGLTAFSPRALRAHGYTAFIELLRAALRHVGGLRIDHVLGLQRLWLVPDGAAATEGAYLRYPIEDLLRLIALESWRARAVVIGEDLGTVPPGLRECLGRAGLMGMRVLWFERDHGLFVDAARWDAGALATTSTHDLPTVAGWWRGCDLGWRARLGQLPPGSDAQAEERIRADDRKALWAAFEYAGIAQGAPPDEPGPVVDAALRFVARTPSKLALLPIEDVLGLEQQANVPGSIEGHPNWRRRLPVEAEAALDFPEVEARLAAVREERK